MAGDWIKMRADLRRHPKVVRMVSALNADRLRVVGGLHAVWSVFDEQTEDGFLPGYTPAAMDEEIGWPGFSAAMIAIEWLFYEVGQGLKVPEFSEHNGQSAKRRATETKRKRNERANGAQSVPNMSAPNADKKRSREDKREEKKNTPLPPAGGCKRFEEFWTAWPKSDRKQDKVKCADKWRRGGLDDQAEAILSDLDRRKGGRKWREADGQYIEAPLTYLNGKRWEDGADIESEAMETFL